MQLNAAEVVTNKIKRSQGARCIPFCALFVQFAADRFKLKRQLQDLFISSRIKSHWMGLMVKDNDTHWTWTIVRKATRERFDSDPELPVRECEANLESKDLHFFLRVEVEFEKELVRDQLLLSVTQPLGLKVS